jgi:hypothetical protein
MHKAYLLLEQMVHQRFIPNHYFLNESKAPIFIGIAQSSLFRMLVDEGIEIESSAIAKE